ncbi:MAG: alpha/beta fold hydrolase [Chitinispirillia bacterium]|jgi:pimeloyl-ACP methyl ester carboxylesterase
MIKIGLGRAPQAFNIFKSHEADWFFKRTLEQMCEKGAEIGECLYTARQIDETDRNSWINEWTALGDCLKLSGDKSLNMGHKVSAREAYLRASNYYRAVEGGALPSDERFHEAWSKNVQAFKKAAELFNPAVRCVEIPFEGKMLPGYFWSPDESGEPRPTLFISGGNDSWIEELFNFLAPGAHRRGYNFFTFDYPGHRGAVHLYPDCIKRPDFEVPFKAAFDYLETLPGVDDRIALAGYSFGGYVAPRVTIHEPRVKALIADCPLIYAYDITRKAFEDILDNKIPKEKLQALLEEKMKNEPIFEAYREYALWTLGFSGKTMMDYMKSDLIRQFTIVDDLHKISCPTLSLVSEDEGEIFLEQSTRFHEGISSIKKELKILSLSKDGTNDHCQLDNISKGQQLIFDWLDSIFEYRYVQ